MYFNSLLNNIVNDMGQIRRKYSVKGERRDYKQLRLDPDTHAKIQRIADAHKLSLLQVVEKLANEAIEQLDTSEKTDFQK